MRRNMMREKLHENENNYTKPVKSMTFFKNVLIGMIFPSPISETEVRRVHEMANNAHNEHVKLREEINEQFRKTEELLNLYTHYTSKCEFRR